MTATRILLLALFLSSATAALAADPASDEFWYGTAADGGPAVNLYFFWTPTCPHCQTAMPFIDGLNGRLPWVQVRSYSVRESRANARFYFETARSIGADAQSVPGFLFCRQAAIGFDTPQSTGERLVSMLEECRARRMSAPAQERAAAVDAAPHGTGVAIGVTEPATTTGTTVRLPIIGEVDTQRWSLPLMTLVLAGVDAFNPCAFFVLLFLLSLLVHARSRARMLVVGGVFVLFSGLAYFVFMAAWLNVFLIAGELRVITLAAGLLALTVGAINVKDFFWFKQRVSLSIPDSARPRLFRRMRAIVAAGSIGPMLASTILLAIVANSYELLCTAGFPMVYTRALTLANLSSWQHYSYLALYNFIYVLPLLAIVFVFVRTMGARKLAESEGRVLKLVSGYMMGAFGIVLLLAPEFLVNALASLTVLVTAIAATWLTLRLWPGQSASAQR